MLALALTLLLTQAPPMSGPPVPGAPKGPPPDPRDLVELYFRGGDLRKSVENCKVWLKKNKKKAEPVCKALVNYQYLASKGGELTLDEAKQFIAFDRLISPTVPALLTTQVSAKFVDMPLQLATSAARGGDRARAEKIARDVLAVDPANATAKGLLDGADAGR